MAANTGIFHKHIDYRAVIPGRAPTRLAAKQESIYSCEAIVSIIDITYAAIIAVRH